jgi:hypothetical protein
LRMEPPPLPLHVLSLLCILAAVGVPADSKLDGIRPGTSAAAMRKVEAQSVLLVSRGSSCGSRPRSRNARWRRAGPAPPQQPAGPRGLRPVTVCCPNGRPEGTEQQLLITWRQGASSFSFATTDAGSFSPAYAAGPTGAVTLAAGRRSPVESIVNGGVWLSPCRHPRCPTRAHARPTIADKCNSVRAQ